MKSWLRQFLNPSRPISNNEMGALTVLSGGSYAGFSVVGLFFVSFFGGPEQAGIFGLALTIAQQVVTIGWFNVRRFQASDCREQFSYADYLGTRIVTVALMVLAGGIWAMVGPYSREKQGVILLFVALKASEAFSDVLAGRYQQKERFDTSCRILFLKTVLSSAVFAILLWMGGSLTMAVGAMFVCHVALTVLLDGSVLPLFSQSPWHPAFARIRQLLMECFPLFATSFLFTYLHGAPKFAIDRILGEYETAVYCALSMASLVILLLTEFLINPQIAHLSLLRAQGKESAFRASLMRLFWGVMGFGAIGYLATYAVGTPVLSVCFRLDLTPYRTLLCVLFGGGILLALSQISQLILVLLRRQFWCLPGIVIASLVAFFGSSSLVERQGLLGGGIGFLVSIATMLVFHTIPALFFLRSRNPSSCT